MTTRLRHVPVMVPRPRIDEGISVECGSEGLRLTDARDLSDDVCAVYGYGLTNQQIESVTVPQFHTATPLLELEGQRLFEERGRTMAPSDRLRPAMSSCSWSRQPLRSGVRGCSCICTTGTAS